MPDHQRARLLLIFSVGLLWRLPAAQPATLTAETVPCPLCGESVVGFRPANFNQENGCDRDFCTHDSGEQPFYHLAWTCTRCLYSGRPDDFHRTLTEEQRKQLRGRLVPYDRVPEDATNFTLPASIKYDLALQCARVVEVSPAELGRTALHGAWCTRLEASDQFVDRAAVSYLVGDASASLAAIGNPAERELAAADILIASASAMAATAPEKAATLAWFAARLYRAHGELVEASRALVHLAAWDQEALYARDRLDLADSITREQRFYRVALAAFDSALTHARDEIVPHDIGVMLYQMGEMHRRLGDLRNAERYYQAGLAAPRTIPAVERMLRYQLAAIREVSPEALPSLRARPDDPAAGPHGMEVAIPDVLRRLLNERQRQSTPPAVP